VTALPPGNQEFVRQLLADSGVDTSLPLQNALLDLRETAMLPAPAPSAELAAFMVPAPVPLRRPRRRFRGAAIGLAIAAATGLGVSGVAAANPQFQTAADDTVRRIVGFFAPAAGATLAPDRPGPEPDSGPGAADPAQPVPETTRSKPARTPAPATARPPGSTAATPAETPAGTGRATPPPRATPHPSGRGLLPTSLPTPADLPVHGNTRSGNSGLQLPDPADLPKLPVVPEAARTLVPGSPAGSTPR